MTVHPAGSRPQATRPETRAPGSPAAAPGPRAPHRTVGSVLGGLLVGMRPRQWVKSVLVPAAPAAAGMLGHATVLWHTIVAVITFTACAAGGYLVNDAADVEQDRRHPEKRKRPVASGRVPVRVAQLAGVCLVLGGILIGGVAATWQLSVVLIAYVAVTLTYSTWLKHVAIIEMMMVAAGFLLRPIAGAAATHTPLSPWFLIVASFGSLYMVVGKRYAEVVGLGNDAVGHRRILGEYTANYLRQIRELCASVTLIAYCLWAFEQRADAGPAVGPWSQLSIIPIAFGLFRYGLLLEKGQGGAPEDVVLRDRQLLIAGAVWLLLFCLGLAKVPL
jgi:decaprenyl-phosphate phosphoribosyltransferase